MAKKIDKDAVVADAFGDFMKQMQRDKPNQVRLLSDNSGESDTEVVPTGAISVDVAVACGGLPLGRQIEIYGPEMSGKTSIALSTAGNAIRKFTDKRVGFVDAEHALNKDHARDMGVDLDKMVIYQPDSGEDGIGMIESMCKSGAFSIVIVDSVAALVPQAEIEADLESLQPGNHARMMSRAMRRITGAASKTDTMVIWINQIRNKIGGYGNPETTTGGKALAFFASIRIEVRSSPSKKITNAAGKAIGQETAVKITKNKMGPPHETCTYDLYFGQGIQSEGAVLDTALRLEFVQKSAATYTEVETGEKIAVGIEKAKKRLQEDDEMRARLEARIYDYLKNGAKKAPLLDAEAEGSPFDEDDDASVDSFLESIEETPFAPDDEDA